jgi:cytochrome oxidase Cu insertion factor (SCO1/SenC/PrrC family)
MSPQHFFKLCKSKTALTAGIAGVALLAFAAMATTPKTPEFLPLHVQVGQKAPDFSLPSTDGSTVSLSQFAGHNVLLDFYEGYW